MDAAMRSMGTLDPLTAEQKPEPRIVQRDSFMVIGKPCRGEHGEHPGEKKVGEICEEFFTRLRSTVPNRVNEHIDIGICSYEPGGNGRKFSYLAGVQVSSLKAIPEGMEARIIPAHTYAVFTHYAHTTPDKIEGHHTAPLYNYIQNTWLPESGYMPVQSFDMEIVDEGKVRADYCELELWIPIR